MTRLMTRFGIYAASIHPCTLAALVDGICLWAVPGSLVEVGPACCTQWGAVASAARVPIKSASAEVGLAAAIVDKESIIRVARIQHPMVSFDLHRDSRWDHCTSILHLNGAAPTKKANGLYVLLPEKCQERPVWRNPHQDACIYFRKAGWRVGKQVGLMGYGMGVD
jgi:hypothetical protein